MQPVTLLDLSCIVQCFGIQTLDRPAAGGLRASGPF